MMNLNHFEKGYADDVGIDVVLAEDVIFRPFETKVIDTKLKIKPSLGYAIMMCSRTSAAKRGIIVNQCPIDPNYDGTFHIIAHNVSDKFVTFPNGKAFAQIYMVKFEPISCDISIKKDGIRGDKNFGSTDEVERDDYFN